MTFSSQFYDTNRLDIWLSYEENMNESSIWWGTVYALKNNSAIAKENENSHKPGKHSEVPAVAWWQIGNEVIFRIFSLEEYFLLHLELKALQSPFVLLVQTFLELLILIFLLAQI